MAEKTRAKRRRSSFGTVRKLGPNRYRAYYRAEGVRQELGIFESDQLAGDALAEARVKESKGMRTDAQRGKVPFAQYAEEWLANHPGLRHTTRSKYRNLLDLHILPARFASKAVSAVTEGDISAWYLPFAAALVEKENQRVAALRVKREADGDSRPVTPHKVTGLTTRADAYRLVATICNEAVRAKLIVQSPCQIKGGGVDPAEERGTATVPELIAAVDALEDHQRAAIMSAAWLTMRRGEILGLRRKNVDLEAGTVRIEKTWTSNGGVAEGPTKSDAGRRTSYIPSNLTPILAFHLDHFVDPEPDALLFPGAKEGRPVTGATVDTWWRAARATVGRNDLTLHDLRHSGLTWAAASGASTAALMRQAGHASPGAALRYQHATDEQAKAVAATLGALAEQENVTHISAARHKGSRKERALVQQKDAATSTDTVYLLTHHG